MSFLTSNVQAQNITGTWNGVLNVMGNQLTLVFHIEKADSGYTATFDSPDQGSLGIPFTSVKYDAQAITLNARNIGAFYKGTVTGDSLTGTWNQGGQAFALNMSRNEVQKESYNRPQEPQKPYPYIAKEVTFSNESDSLTLAGTLTLPADKGPHPVVVLISGSGPQNRDEEVFGHKPFLVLADHLTRNGIAVLRYDDRGTAESTGNYAAATSKDFAQDVVHAVAFLKNQPMIDSSNIGLIGHSEGGLIAPMVANQSPDVSFVVLLAGTGVTGKEISLMQAQTLTPLDIPDQEAFQQFNKKAIEIASSDKDISVLREELAQHYQRSKSILKQMLPEGMDVDAFIKQQVETSLRPWSRFFYNYDPATELRQLTVPVLSLIGTRDVQVPAKMNHPAIRRALKEAGNKDYTIKELKGLNHMFQESESGTMQEYAEIEQTIAPAALNEITQWILDHTK